MKFFKSRLFRVLTSIISIFFIIALSREIYGLWRRKDIIRQRTDALTFLERQNADLQRELAQVQSSTFIEQMAREKLGLIKVGEEIVLVPTVQSSGASQMNQVKQDTNPPYWRLWWRLFF